MTHSPIIRRALTASAVTAGAVVAAGTVAPLIPYLMRRPEAIAMPPVDDQTGDVVVVASSGPYHNLIKAFGRSRFTHTYVMLNRELALDPTYPHMKVISVEEMRSRHKEFACSKLDLSPEERQRLGVEIHKMVGSRYGLEAIWWFAASIALQRQVPGLSRVGAVCSTAVAYIYRRSGLFDRLGLGDQRPESVTPGDLARALGFTPELRAPSWTMNARPEPAVMPAPDQAHAIA